MKTRGLINESLLDRESSLLPDTLQTVVEGNSFEGQLRTRQALDENRDSLVETMGYLRKRVDLLVQGDDPEKDNERSRLQADINISKEDLGVCKVASEVSRQKVHKIEEVIAECDSHQVFIGKPMTSHNSGEGGTTNPGSRQ